MVEGRSNPRCTTVLNKHFAHCCNGIQLTEAFMRGRNHGLIAINRHAATDSNGALVSWCLYCNISQDACELSKPFRAICPNNPTVSSPNTLLCKETPFIFIRANSPDGCSPLPSLLWCRKCEQVILLTTDQGAAQHCLLCTEHERQSRDHWADLTCL